MVIIFNNCPLFESYCVCVMMICRTRNLFYKEQEMQRPLLLSSVGASGCIVSNTQEQMIFLKAFNSL